MAAAEVVSSGGDESLTLGKLKSRQHKETHSSKQEWNSKLKKAKGGDKRKIKREMKAAQTEMLNRHKKEISDISANKKAETETQRKMEDAEWRSAQMEKWKENEKKRKERANIEAQRMKAAELEASEMEDLRLVEKQKLESILLPLNLGIFDIEADGHCLYRSISHQLSIAKSQSQPSQPSQIESKNDDDDAINNNAIIELSFGEVRKLSSDYMNENASDFLPFLTNDNGTAMSQSDFKQYLRKVASIDAIDSNGVLWGGHTELVAISAALRLPIVVYSVKGTPQIIFNRQIDLNSYNQPLIRLSFHEHLYSLGEHYSSVVSIDTLKQLMQKADEKKGKWKQV